MSFWEPAPLIEFGSVSIAQKNLNNNQAFWRLALVLLASLSHDKRTVTPHHSTAVKPRPIHSDTPTFKLVLIYVDKTPLKLSLIHTIKASFKPSIHSTDCHSQSCVPSVPRLHLHTDTLPFKLSIFHTTKLSSHDPVILSSTPH